VAEKSKVRKRRHTAEYFVPWLAVITNAIEACSAQKKNPNHDSSGTQALKMGLNKGVRRKESSPSSESLSIL
jgi:hypothetical protein